MLFELSSVQQYAQTMRLRQEWVQKQSQIGKHPLIEQMQRACDDQKKSSIISLMSAGKRLTQDEKEYLRSHDPNLYHQAVTIEEEQRSFKKSLQYCRTKEEANDLYFAKVWHFSDAMTHISKDTPSAAAQGSALQFTAARSAAISEAFMDFKSEGKYSKLPTEQELREKELHRTRNAKRHLM